MSTFTEWKYVPLKFFIIFFPFSIVVGGILSVIYNTEIEASHKIIWSQERNKVKIQEQIISKDFKEIVSELRVISNSHELKKLINDKASDMIGTANDFMQISKYKGLYDQIRYLDQTGMEIIRINYNDGKPEAVPKSKLQNKSKRYYFADTVKLNSDEVFISPLDLNVEHGKIEQPLKPMIRFGIPLVKADGEKRGIVLLNYFAGIMINNLERFASQGFGQFALLNSEGYWLSGKPPENNWGFMYEDKKEIVFGYKFPEEWTAIVNKDSEQILSKNGLFTFSTFYPLLEAQKSSTGSGKPFTPSSAAVEGGGYFFKIVSHVPNVTLKETSNRIFNKLFRLFIAINGVLLIGAFAVAYFWDNKRKIESERQKMLVELQQSLDEVKTLQGILPICSYCKQIRDDKGYWNKVDSYVADHTEVKFSHSVCPDCMKEHHPDVNLDTRS